MTMDLNSGSGFQYGIGVERSEVSTYITGLVDASLVAKRSSQVRRDYLGASRIGEPCERKLVYEFTGAPVDKGREPDGRLLRIFDAGNVYEELSVGWQKLAGFDLRTHKRHGDQFGFAAAGVRIRGHIDGVIINGPKLGIPLPVLWEHKSAASRSWSEFAKLGLQRWLRLPRFSGRFSGLRATLLPGPPPVLLRMPWGIDSPVPNAGAPGCTSPRCN